jgi:hypothetical protein
MISGYPKRAAWFFRGRAALCLPATARSAMNENQELRILVDRAIDHIRMPHGPACSCSFCMIRPGNHTLSPTFLPPSRNRFSRSDPFLVRSVVPLVGPLPQSHLAPRPLVVGAPMAVRGRTAERKLRRQLWSPAGVFLSGATQQQALRWAQRQAARVRGTVTGATSGRSRTSVISDSPHRGGRPHFHIELRSTHPGQPPRRSGHIFWGRLPPSGVFFEADDN